MLEFVMKNYLVVLQIASYVIAGCSAALVVLAPLTKSLADDKLSAALKRVLSVLGLIALNPKAPK